MMMSIMFKSAQQVYKVHARITIYLGVHIETFFEQANLLKLMAHPMRLQILTVLSQDAECVCHLSAVLDKPQPYVSQQLAVLRNAGIIVDQKEGTNVFYGLASGRIGSRVRAVLAPLADELQAGEERGHRRISGCCCPKCSAEV
jgi:DNA-binding transcriptional ArsR family regulator